MRAEEGQPAQRLRWRGQLRTVPLVVWALTGLQLAVLIGYSTLMPVYRAPDEPQNVDIVMAARGFTQSTVEHRSMDPAVLRSYPFAGFSHTFRRAPVDPSPPAARGTRPTFGDLAGAAGTAGTAGAASAADTAGAAGVEAPPNQQWQHPPLYPATVGAALTAVTALYPPAGAWAFDQTVGFARAMSFMAIAPLPLLSFLVARRLTANTSVALTAAVVPLTIPQLAHIGAAVNHDSLVTLLVGLVTVAVAFVVRGDDSVRTAGAVGALSGLALLTKGFALFLPAWLAGAYLLAAVRWRRARFLAAGAGAVALAVLLGGWWWVRNLAVHGTLQPTGVPLPSPDAGFVPDLAGWTRGFGEVMAVRFWGNLGWYQARLPGWVVALATATALAGVAASFRWRRPGGPGRPDLAVMAFPAVAIGAIVVYGGWGYYTQTGLALGLQGRYLYPGLVGLAVLAGAGLGTLPVRVGRWAPLAVLAAAVALHATTVATVLADVYQAGTGISLGRAAGAVAAWSPWPAGVLAVNLVAVAGLLAGSAWLLVDSAAPWRSMRGRHTLHTIGLRRRGVRE